MLHKLYFLICTTFLHGSPFMGISGRMGQWTITNNEDMLIPFMLSCHLSSCVGLMFISIHFFKARLIRQLRFTLFPNYIYVVLFVFITWVCVINYKKNGTSNKSKIECVFCMWKTNTYCVDANVKSKIYHILSDRK